MERENSHWFVLVAGVNGAGKSTFTQSPETLLALLERSGTSKVEVINPDNETQAILAEYPDIGLQEANRKAAVHCEQMVGDFLDRREGSFAIETVLSTEKYRPIVERAQELGWNILFIYIALESVEDSVSRVARRVARGGHDVPEDKIRARWARSRAHFQWFWERADIALLFLNPNESTPRKIWEKFVYEDGFVMETGEHPVPPCVADLVEGIRLR